MSNVSEHCLLAVFQSFPTYVLEFTESSHVYNRKLSCSTVPGKYHSHLFNIKDATLSCAV